AGLQPVARPAAQPEHAGRVGLDPQAPFVGMQCPFDARGRHDDRAGLENLVRQFDGGRHSVILWALYPLWELLDKSSRRMHPRIRAARLRLSRRYLATLHKTFLD